MKRLITICALLAIIMLTLPYPAYAERNKSIYLAIADKNGMVMVVKKRIVNSWWEGEIQRSQVVNQAGQYALPGGRQNGAESRRETAIREFYEETGIDLNHNNEFRVLNDAFILNDYYAVVLGYVPNIDELSMFINVNIETNDPAALQPPQAYSEVSDWELGLAFRIPVERIEQYLGVQNNHGDEFTRYRTRLESHRQRYPYRHSIDWYGEIGSVLSQQLIGILSGQSLISPNRVHEFCPLPVPRSNRSTS